MSQRRNYGFERRRRADAQRAKQQAKQQAKQERKAIRAETGAVGPDMGAAQEVGVPLGMWEWFSPSRTRVVTTAHGVRPETDPPDDWVLLTEIGTDSTGGPRRSDEAHS